MLVSYFYQNCKINDFGFVQAMVSMGKAVLVTKKTETITWVVAVAMAVAVMVLMTNSMYYLQILMIIALVMNLLSCIKRTLASSIFCLFFFDFFFHFLIEVLLSLVEVLYLFEKNVNYIFFFICFNGRYFPQLIEMVRIFDT